MHVRGALDYIAQGGRLKSMLGVRFLRQELAVARIRSSYPEIVEAIVREVPAGVATGAIG